MKGLVLLLSVLFSSIAFASPVGSWITFDFKLDGTTLGTISYEITADLGNGTYTMTQTTVAGGMSDSMDSVLAADEIWTHEDSRNALANCASFGTPDTLSDSRGRSYQTCKVPVNQVGDLFGKANLEIVEQDGFAWVGDFPILGMGRIFANGQDIVVRDYHWSN